MIAVVGIPGSVHHKWHRFGKRAIAEQWALDVWRRTVERHPELGSSLPSDILSDRSAARVRYQDGTPVYPHHGTLP